MIDLITFLYGTAERLRSEANLEDDDYVAAAFINGAIQLEEWAAELEYKEYSALLERTTLLQ